MTFINRLIKEANADPAPRELMIRPNQVRKLADHAMPTMSHFRDGVKREDIEEIIRGGGLLVCGVPVRVLGG